MGYKLFYDYYGMEDRYYETLKECLDYLEEQSTSRYYQNVCVTNDSDKTIHMIKWFY